MIALAPQPPAGAAPQPPADAARALLLPDDEHDRALVALAHPPAWVNPSPASRYDLVVIGGGTAGLVTAAGAAGLGARVALVERHLLGGDCLVTGCVPSKGLLAAAHAVHAARAAASFGLRVEGTPDFGAAMERMRRLRAGIARNDAAERLAGLGVHVFLGDARFQGPGAVLVDGRRLAFSRAVIATGARAARPGVPGLEETGYLTNETVFELTRLPPRLAVIGSGPIGCELAQAFGRLGSEVSIVSLDPRVLPREDPDAAALVAGQLAGEGVRTFLGAKLVRAERHGGGKRLVFDRGRGEETLSCDELLVAVGRTPNVEGLELPAAGVVFDGRGVRVDDRLRTTNRRIYAAGDICSPYKFTHAADAMARVAIQNALFAGRRRASALVIPWSTYTDPEVAHVGISAEQAGARPDVATFTVPLAEVDRAVLDGETAGFVRVHAERRGGRILGATVVAKQAGDLIGEAALAMTHGLGLPALSATVHPYPTRAEAFRKAGDQFQRTRLTPRSRGLLAWWLRLWRLV